MNLKNIYPSIISSWWVIGFILLCLVLFENSLRSRESQRSQLQKQWAQLLKNRENEIAKQKDLQMQINSQSDPAWIELTLIKVLGLVPENQTKIYFEEAS